MVSLKNVDFGMGAMKNCNLFATIRCAVTIQYALYFFAKFSPFLPQRSNTTLLLKTLVFMATHALFFRLYAEYPSTFQKCPGSVV